MIIMFISLISATACFMLFMVGSTMSIVNRIVLSTPKSIFESAIPLIQDSDTFVPYFDKKDLENKLNTYYENNVADYVKEYTLQYYYYNLDDHSFCGGIFDKCRGVEVTFKATLKFNINYQRTLFYEIKEGATYGH